MRNQPPGAAQQSVERGEDLPTFDARGEAAQEPEEDGQDAGRQAESAEPGSGKKEDGAPTAGLADSPGLVASKEVVDAVKDGSSVTQSTVVGQLGLAPTIAEGDPTVAQDPQRDDAAATVESAGRSPQASQSPVGLAEAAAQSRSEAQLKDGTSPLQPAGPDVATSAAEQVEPAQDEPKSAAKDPVEAPDDPESAAKEEAADQGQQPTDAKPSETAAVPDKDEEEKDAAA